MRRLARPKPPRLLDLRPEDDPWKVAPLVRSALRAPEEPTPRVKWRIRNTLRHKTEWRRRFLRVALVGGVIFLTGGVVGAVVGPLWVERTRLAEPMGDPPSAAPPARTGHRRARGRASGLNPTATQPMPEPNAEFSEPSIAATEPVPEIHPVPNQTPVAAAQPAPETGIVSSVAVQRPAVPVPARAAATVPVRAAAKLALVRPTPTLPRIPPAPSASPPAEGGPTIPLSPLPLEPPPIEAKPALRPPQVASAVALHRLPQSVEQPSAPLASHATPLPSPLPPVAPAVVSASEQGLLAAALRSLRSEGRPDRALVALDDYQVRFPEGVLRPEAMRLRTEALLLLGRKRAALHELDRQAFDGATGGEDRRLLRGELRVAEGRWRGAFEDFDAVVRSGLVHEKSSRSGEARSNHRAERALWGRASARSHMGDDTGARTDLREYLRRFPQGRFAGRAARLLGELR